MQNKTSLVTGGAGFIGSHMVDFLISKGHYVIVIDNLSSGKKKNIQKHLKSKKALLLNCKIENFKISQISKKKIDYIFHFAGIGSIVPSITNPTEYIKTNATGTLNILEQTKNLNYRKFVYAASSSCYGKANTPTSEHDKISTLYPYALSKFMGEQLCIHWNNVYKLPTCSIRIFNAYGNRISFDGGYGAMFPVFMKQILRNKPLTIVGDGNQKRDFIHVKDLVKAFYFIAISKRQGEIYNVGSGKPISVLKIAKMLGKNFEFIPKRPGEPNITHANINKIKKHTKWRPEITMEIGIKDMIKNINNWKNAPTWNKYKIAKATKKWFEYLK